MFSSDKILEEHRRINEFFPKRKYSPNPEQIEALQTSLKRSMTTIDLTPQQEADFLFSKWYKLVRGFSCNAMRDVAYACAIEELMGIIGEHSVSAIKDKDRVLHLETVLEVLKNNAK